VSVPPPPTIADGVRTTEPGAKTFPVLQKNLDGILLVSDAAIVAAVRALAVRAHLVVEPTGAVAAAAALARRIPADPGARVGIVLSGGNVDPELLAKILQD